MWAALTLIILLIFLSVYGAFLGADEAKVFFNSLPLTVYWLVFLVAIAAAFAAFRRLIRTPGFSLIHLGCVLVLAGAMWGSDAGHKIQKQFLGIDKIPMGFMAIAEGRSENIVASKDGEPAGTLPFFIKLKDFRIEYYQPAYLQIRHRRGQSWKIPVKIGTEFPLGPDFGTVTILRAFENFRIEIEGDKKNTIDDPQSGSNPALYVQIKNPDGSVTNKYVFERFPDYQNGEDKFLLSYHMTVRDYVSEIEVVENDKVVAGKNIEVNHPLHFGGYHFYQHSYDTQAGRYTILMVVSDTGLELVYAGYFLLGAGVFQHFWLRHVFAGLKTKRRINGD